MDILLMQVLFGLVILSLIIVAFRNKSDALSVSEMSVLALLIVIAAILGRFLAIQIPPGQPLLIISLSTPIIICIGLLYRPKNAIISGVVLDVIGFSLFALAGGVSIYFLGFTLGNILSVLIPSLMVFYLKKLSSKDVSILIFIILVFTNIILSFFLLKAPDNAFGKNSIELTPIIRVMLMFISIIISLGVVIINRIFTKKYDGINNKLVIGIPHLVLVIFFTNFITSVILTSFNIYALYGVPFYIGFLTRLLQNLMLLPIDLYVLYMLLTNIPNEYKKNILK